MKKRFLITLLLYALVYFGFSQDTIYKINGKVIVGKVKEVGSQRITYTVSDEAHQIFRNEIGYIAYSDGTQERFNMNRLENYRASHGLSTKFRKNIIALNTLPIILRDLTISYERILPGGLYSFRIPVSYSFDGALDTTQYEARKWINSKFTENKIFSSGFDFSYYPLGQGKFAYYAGLSSLAGTFYYYDEMHDTILNSNVNGNWFTYPVRSISRYQGKQYAIMLHVGGNLSFSDFLSVGARFAYGYRWEDTIFNDERIPKLQFWLYLACKF
jgi:hypothetical protein